MDNEQLGLAKELLQRKKAILEKALSGKKMPKEEMPSWLLRTVPKDRKQMLKDVDQALERMASDNFGFCQSCFQEIPWAEIARFPERELCETCIAREQILSSMIKSRKKKTRKKKTAKKKKPAKKKKAAKKKPAKKKKATQKKKAVKKKKAARKK